MQPTQKPKLENGTEPCEAQEYVAMETRTTGTSHNEAAAGGGPSAQVKSWLPDISVAVLLVAVFIVDQLSKGWVRSHMLLEESIPSEGFFRLTYTTNTGSAFGLFQNQTTVLTLASFVGIGILILFFRNQSIPQLWLRTSLGLQLGGAAGNLVDRITLGRVTDFIDVGPWPVFNLADASIVTGLVVLAWFLLTTKENPKAPAQPKQEPPPQMGATGPGHIAELPPETVSPLPQPASSKVEEQR